jgi:hypothetical protein
MSMAVALTRGPRSQLDDRSRNAGRHTWFWIVAALPLLLLALSDNWIVSPPGLIDPWVYFGYYQDLPQHLRTFDGTYYGTRLSALLPGYVAYQCLPPLAANYALHLGLYYSCVGSLYWILARTLSPRVGLLAAVCLGCQLFFLQAIGWDYVNGFGITYSFLSLFALTAAARTHFWKSNLVAAGIGSAALVIANTFYVVFLPYLAIHYLYINRQARRNPLLSSLCLYLLGVVGLTLAFCIYNGLVVGRFWFLGPTLHFAHTFAGQTNPWTAPVSIWLPAADWLVLPVLTALGSLFFCFWFRSRLRNHQTAMFYQGQFLFVLVMLIGWEWWGQPVLQLQDYASLLMPATLLALGAQLAPHIDRLSTRQFGVLLAIVLLGLLVPHAWNNGEQWPEQWNRWSGACTVAGGVLALAVLATQQPGALAAAGIVVFFVSIPTCIGWHTFDFSKTRPRTEFFQEEKSLQRERYRASDLLRSVFDAVQVVKTWDPAGQVRFWYHARAPMGKVCTAVASTYLWGYRLVNAEFPALVDPAAFGQLKGQHIVILSADPDALARANGSLEKLGLEGSLLDEQPIVYPSVAFTMYHVAIQEKARSEQPLLVHFDRGAKYGMLSTSPVSISAAEGHSPLPLDQWHPCYEAPRMSLAKSEEGLQLITPAERWAYALLYSSLRVAEEGNYRFELKYSLRNGDIAFGALTEDQSRWLAQAGPASTPPFADKPGVLVKSLSLRLKSGEGFHLLLTNNYPGGSHPSELVIHDMRAFRENSAKDCARRAGEEGPRWRVGRSRSDPTAAPGSVSDHRVSPPGGRWDRERAASGRCRAPGKSSHECCWASRRSSAAGYRGGSSNHKLDRL